MGDGPLAVGEHPLVLGYPSDDPLWKLGGPQRQVPSEAAPEFDEMQLGKRDSFARIAGTE